MPSTRTARLTIRPARRGRNCIISEFSLTNPPPAHDITFTSVAQQLDIAGRLGRDHGTGCQVDVRLSDGGRKPGGFDAAVRSLYYNLGPEGA